ncbi:MAG: hypothetical protein OXE43_01435 [Chloroflexi bacterium]|nr:hypothetical protein [Chloroflexota bacterium]
MAAVLVILPPGVTPPPLPDGVEVRACATATEVTAALDAATGDIVLGAGGLAGDAAIANAVGAVAGTVIQVDLESWDGETHSLVSAACSGVIAGFGTAGIAAAVALLREGA